MISEIDDLLVDLTDIGFEWYFPYFSQSKSIIISIMHAEDDDDLLVDFTVDDTMIDCVNTLVDWMKEKYGIGSVSYILSLCSGSDIKTKQFAEEEFGLALYEIRIVLNL